MPLFPDPPVTIEPALDRQEPVLWVRRIVIVPSLSTDATPVREIPFRPGLNIVRTANRPPGEARVIGHSVGKTLLTRLIRYCLGEIHFAVEPVRKRIAARLPAGHVAAAICVAGQSWVVVRPLRDAPANASWAIQHDNWRAGLARSDGAITFQEFNRVLEQAAISTLPDIPLSNSGREIRWLDLLGWLGRDHECHYRVYNEWREPDAESGTGKLNRDDSSFLMRLVMGLVNADERPLIEAHRQVLADLETTKTDISRLSRFVETTFPLLRSRLELTEEECGNDKQLIGGLFVTRAREVVTNKVRSLKRLSADIRTGSRVAELYDAAVKEAQALAVADNDFQRAIGLKQQAEAELRQREQSSAEDYYKSFSPARNCPAEDCPLKPTSQTGGQPDPERAARIDELRALLTRHDDDISRLRQKSSQLQRSCDEAQTRYKDEQARLNRNVRGVSREIGRWKLLVEQAEDYEKNLSDLAKAEGRFAKLERDYQESLGQLEAARTQQAARIRRLSQFFDWTLKQLVSPDASGAITVDARGLHPAPDETVAANGAALATLATVIGLDLTCLIASVCGLGHHPRLIIHDSPREAEMESVLFHHIFRLVGDLEATFGSARTPSFQYIVTTSSSIPDEFAAEPYTRLVLDARHDSGLLLGVRF